MHQSRAVRDTFLPSVNHRRPFLERLDATDRELASDVLDNVVRPDLPIVLEAMVVSNVAGQAVCTY